MEQGHVAEAHSHALSAKEARLLELEKKLAWRKGFWRGLLVCLLVVSALTAAGGFYIWANRMQVLEWVVSNFLLDIAREVFASFPDAYMTLNRDHALEVLDEFTNAVAADKVTRTEFAELGRDIFAALRDKQLTYQEVNGFLERMHAASVE